MKVPDLPVKARWSNAQGITRNDRPRSDGTIDPPVGTIRIGWIWQAEENQERKTARERYYGFVGTHTNRARVPAAEIELDNERPDKVFLGTSRADLRCEIASRSKPPNDGYQPGRPIEMALLGPEPPRRRSKPFRPSFSDRPLTAGRRPSGRASRSRSSIHPRVPPAPPKGRESSSRSSRRR